MSEKELLEGITAAAYEDGDYIRIEKQSFLWEHFRPVKKYLDSIVHKEKLIIDLLNSEASASPLLRLIQEAAQIYGKDNVEIQITAGSMIENVLEKTGFKEYYRVIPLGIKELTYQ